jgi:hypothetical protein
MKICGVRNAECGIGQIVENGRIFRDGRARHSVRAVCTHAQNRRARSDPPHPAYPQSQRDCVIQPRVARHELPWVNFQTNPSTQKGLWHSFSRNGVK